MTLEDKILKKVNEAVGKSIVEALTGYNGALKELTNSVVRENSEDLRRLINEEFSNLLNGDGFKSALQEALNQKLAKTLVSRMGGELEKRVNELRQNPETRAKVTLALSKIIDDIGK